MNRRRGKAPMITAMCRGAISCVLAAAAAAASPVLASALLAVPPDKFIISPGGVDMRSGRYAYSQTDLSVGGAGGLELTRTLKQQVKGHISPFASFSHNFDMMVVETKVNINQGNFRNGTGSDYQIQVAFGGLSQTFRSPGTPGYNYALASQSSYAILTYAGGDRSTGTTVYTYQASDGTTAVFRSIGSGDCSSTFRCAYVSQLTRADGTVLTFQYDTNGTGVNKARLRSITSSRGHALLLEYSGMQVVKACALNLALTAKPATNVCPAAVPTATYAYDTAAGETRLASVTDPGGAAWGFVNTANSIGFVNPGESSPWLTNQLSQWFDDDATPYDIITAQNFADGRSYAYGYNTAPPIPDHVPPLAGGVVMDGQGRSINVVYSFPKRPGSPAPGQQCTRWPCSPYEVGEEEAENNYVYQMTPGPVAIVDPLGRTTTKDYCDPNAMANLPANEQYRCLVSPAAVSTTDPGGITTHLTWDFVTFHLLQSRQVARSGSGLSDIIRSATYNCTPATIRFCDKPTSYTDANGNVTSFTYDPAHGGMLSEMKPAPSTGAARPLKLTGWVQKYAWYKNASGVLTQAATPVWVVASETQCQTAAGSSAAVCDAGAPQRVTSYEYGANGTANNLNVRGTVVSAGGVSRRTCFSYDGFGNRISQTGARAGLATCP